MAEQHANLKDYDSAIRCYKEALFHYEGDTKVCWNMLHFNNWELP